jgi:hypothetical protein
VLLHADRGDQSESAGVVGQDPQNPGAPLGLPGSLDEPGYLVLSLTMSKDPCRNYVVGLRFRREGLGGMRS